MSSRLLVTGNGSSSSSLAQDDIAPACHQLVRQDILRLLRRQAGLGQYPRFWKYAKIAAERAVEDVVALARQDPAAGGSWEYVARSYASYQAVIAYRLAHLLAAAERDNAALARRISEDAKVRTGIEIHPAASIGRRFILDHATGTVIGETTVIGDDCYLLQGVILGATGIAGNEACKRHPTLGDRVQVGAFARVFGPVTVGSDARIGPHAVVTTDIPPGSHVYLMNQCQIRSPRTALQVFGVVPLREGVIEIHGAGLTHAEVRMVDANDQVLLAPTIQVIDRASNRLACLVGTEAAVPAGAVLRIAEPGGERVLVTQLASVWYAVRGPRPPASPGDRAGS